MNCGHGAQPASLVADANPGSTIAFSWRNGEGGTWVHNTGPVMTYMAPCGSGGCANFSGEGAQFFKIGQLGQEGDDQHWAMTRCAWTGSVNWGLGE
jgi:Auxiliary Activity family 9 (formerly GH61)